MSKPETHHFQAEIQQLLDIVIHSLYTDKEIFVRELISNAADACEKLRFNQSSGQAIHQPDIAPAITVTTDDKAGTITITDTGLGMTHGELVENLGTIAHSGTKAFLKQLAEEKKPDVGLIGQFGVGFYSAFMVAKRVTVWSRSFAPEEPGWQWTSEGGGGYELTPATDLPRGTKITLELKDDAKEFAQNRHRRADHPAVFELRAVPHRTERQPAQHRASHLGAEQERDQGGGIQRVLHVRRPRSRQAAVPAAFLGGCAAGHPGAAVRAAAEF